MPPPQGRILCQVETLSPVRHREATREAIQPSPAIQGRLGHPVLSFRPPRRAGPCSAFDARPRPFDRLKAQGAQFVILHRVAPIQRLGSPTLPYMTGVAG